MTIPHFAYCLAEGVVLIVALRNGVWRRFPLFVIYIAASLAFELGFDPFRPVDYPLKVSPVILFRTLAIGEAYWCQTINLPRRGLLAVAFALIAVMCSGSLLWACVPAGAYRDAIQVRRFSVIAGACFLLADCLFFQLAEFWQANCAFRHVCMQTLMAGALAASSILHLIWPHGIWLLADQLFYWIGAVLMLLWAGFVGAFRASLPDYPNPAYRP